MKETQSLVGIFKSLMNDAPGQEFSYARVAQMLKTDPEALQTFEAVYKKQVLDGNTLPENILQWDTATVKGMLDKKVPFTRELYHMIDRIVRELINGTRVYIYTEGRNGYYVQYSGAQYSCYQRGSPTVPERTSPAAYR